MSRNIFIIAGVIVLVAALGGYYVFFDYPKSQSLPSTEPQNEPRVFDILRLYSVEIPSGWSIAHEGSAGVRLSQITAESPDWKFRSETADGPYGGSTYYKTGASIQFHVSSVQAAPPYHGASDDPESGVISKKEVSIDGEKATYHVFKEPSLKEGLLLDAHVNYNANSYTFRFAYNPSTYSQGEEIFMHMLNSVHFEK